MYKINCPVERKGNSLHSEPRQEDETLPWDSWGPFHSRVMRDCRLYGPLPIPSLSTSNTSDQRSSPGFTFSTWNPEFLPVQSQVAFDSAQKPLCLWLCLRSTEPLLNPVELLTPKPHRCILSLASWSFESKYKTWSFCLFLSFLIWYC